MFRNSDLPRGPLDPVIDVIDLSITLMAMFTGV
jgi:hypothetical protein